ncbi:(2Fe-2S)-binding protein [Roseobacter weihaiensis]|uniref:(2Fe-2S)-binding protein n=1 Tax=Roseobacter weihaiensis TaxID=2763262 RepID=UPI001D0A79A2|nr:(2Fe-2S)-binding protein [Roseobacter sp. H9]
MLKLRINGQLRAVTSAPDTPLAYVLRDEFKLKGTKIGCGLEQCGACTVLADDEAVQSCATPAAVFEGRAITTIEGLSQTPEGKRVQQAFVAQRAAQCGYCTAGLVVAVTSLLRTQGAFDRATAQTALRGHLCRCGSHPRVLAAAEAAQKGDG